MERSGTGRTKYVNRKRAYGIPASAAAQTNQSARARRSSDAFGDAFGDVYTACAHCAPRRRHRPRARRLRHDAVAACGDLMHEGMRVCTVSIRLYPIRSVCRIPKPG